MGPSPNSEVRHQNQLTVKTNALALIVEDDPATRALEQIVLEADRFAVRTANNGEEWRRAIRLARERCPAVIRWTSPGRLRLASMFEDFQG
jgi:response regulator RpfG family c-di-GMP phosphodiesterase